MIIGKKDRERVLAMEERLRLDDKFEACQQKEVITLRNERAKLQQENNTLKDENFTMRSELHRLRRFIFER